ncbi:3-oxoacyl-ACP reductase FabG [Schinkia azotoformans]|uniref:3-oxoacyl-ACP reductase FabG n=1 Tax=Schinkia azotoformans TaxID=1454 RepID=UPI002DB64CE8|nr:3-oxoacyl-ACP reductase FabG [Schinkia azotoformans]MEC1717071.1 3-oxoacyl-ACP reductase FabG [Schinkia azotoformans]MEC1741885.1 3-oxoacyl-ACP reductase FabG [Schinkia azotoformans]MEC1747434.1 3-oxoacyl-ACP reductase FabG [Schinkia azotoformans]MEC1758127.1 3-oxoacyl-ACP reductase FabG [Schinkia azotoformans]MEC1766473.1 3-oxoacyl-ACP reductase FabG [Schinkia azotoformans]
MNSLKGKTVIVTGGSKGIGKGIARVFANHGANVAVVARDLSTAETCAAEINGGEGRVVAFSANVTDRKSMESMVQKVAETFGGIDVLCANAGIFPSAPLEEMTDDDWDTVMNTNAKGTFISVQTCIPFLKKAEFGRIVITSSITGPVTGYPGWAHYAASKAAQLGFMRTTSLELAADGITVNAVMPGNILTEGLEGMGEDYLNEMAASIPMKKLGTVEDIGYAALFLASKEAGFITGQTIIVDGGQILPEN